MPERERLRERDIYTAIYIYIYIYICSYIRTNSFNSGIDTFQGRPHLIRAGPDQALKPLQVKLQSDYFPSRFLPMSSQTAAGGRFSQFFKSTVFALLHSFPGGVRDPASNPIG